MKSNIPNNKGQTLIIVMLVAIVLLIVVISLTSKAILNTSQNSITYSGEKAFAAAQTGIQNALSIIGKTEFSSPNSANPQTPPNTGNCQTNISNKQQCNYIISTKITPTNTVKQGATLPINLQGTVVQTTHNITTTTYTGKTNTWTNTTQLPSNITSAGISNSQGNAYVIGGYNGGIMANTYKGSLTNTGVPNWVNQQPLPNPTKQNASVSNGQYIYSIGGNEQYSYSYSYCYNYPYTYTYYEPVYFGYDTVSWYGYWVYSPGDTYWVSYPIYTWHYYIYYVPHTVTYWYYTCQTETYTYTSITNSVYYAPLNNGNIGGWNGTSSLPQSIYDTTAVEYNNYIYLFGGRNSSGTPVNTVYRTQIQSNGTLNGWSQINTLPDGALYGIAGKEFNSTIYLAGGYNGSSSTNTLLEYNSNTNSFTNTILPENVYNEGISIISTTSTNASGATINTPYIYIYGGIVTQSFPQTTLIYSCRWHYNSPYYGYAYSNYYGDGYYLWYYGYHSPPEYYCGYSPTTTYTTTTNISNSTYYASLNTPSNWNTTSSMITPTQKMGYVTFNNIMYAIGGSNTTVQSPINTVEYTSPLEQIQHTVTTSTSINENSLLINISNGGSFEVQIVYGSQNSESIKSCIEQNATSGSYVIPIQTLINATVAYITPLSNAMTMEAYPTSQIPSGSSNITNCTP